MTTPQSEVVEGASDSTLLFRRKRFVAARAPSTILLCKMVPLHRCRPLPRGRKKNARRERDCIASPLTLQVPHREEEA